MSRIYKKIKNTLDKSTKNFRPKSKFQYAKTFKKMKLYETRYGKFFLPNSKHDRDDIVIKAIINNKIFDSEVANKVLAHYAPNTTILDVGANFGQMSIYFANEINFMNLERNPSKESKHKIIAFEAEPNVHTILEKNIKINELDAIIRTIKNPVWHTKNEILIFPEPDLKVFKSWGSYGIDPSKKHGRSFISTTIDACVDQEKISVIKIDLQGSDLAAMRGMVRTILANQPIIIFEYEEIFSKNFGTNFQSYLNFIDEIYYEIFWEHSNNFGIRPKMEKIT